MNNKDVCEIDFQIVARLRQIIRAVAIFSKEVKMKSGLNASQLACLAELAESSEMSLRELSVAIHVSPSSITKIIDALEEKNFVRRKRTETDRRVLKAEITEMGMATVYSSPQSLQKRMLEGLSQLSTTAKQEIDANLEKLALLIDAQELPSAPVLDTVEKTIDEPRLDIAYESTSTRETG
jgi:DNA-binding MarR family transcriptional regulator